MVATSERTKRPPTWREVEKFAHTGPGTLTGRYMRMFWQPVALARELEPGRTKPLRIMSEDFTLYRGESGTPHVVAFRCAHRGTQLSVGWVEGDNIRCFYHGWMYDASGQCVEQPAEPKPFCQKVNIRSYPTEEYLGLIFAYLGEGEPPPLPRYRQAEGAGVLDTWAAIVPCNYFNALENDPMHTYFVHRRPGHDWHDFEGDVPVVFAEETAYGTRQYKVQSDGKPFGFGYHGMPNITIRNLSQNVQAWGATASTAMVWKVPIDDEGHWRIGLDAVHLTGEAAREYVEQRNSALAKRDIDSDGLVEPVLQGKLRMEDIDRERTYMVRVQDGVSQGGQGVIADREHEALGRTDATVILRRKIWSRETRALAEGRPLKQWTEPDDLVVE